MRFSALATAAILVFSTPVAAFAQQGYQWVYDRYITPSAYDSDLNLTYGVPQTDDIQFAAHCVFGAQGPFVRVTMGADIGPMAHGTPTTLQVSGNGYVQAITASVVRFEEFLYGVEFPLATNDPFLRALAAQNALIYAVPGQQSHTLGLRGSAGPVRQFAADCANIQRLARDSAGRPDPSAPLTKQTATAKPGDFGCNLFPGLASRNSDTPQTVTFVNQSGEYRTVMWLDFNGQPVEYAALNPGESTTIASFLTHPWMFTDGPGNCIQIIELQPGVSSYAIAAASPGFGDE
ncbi:hypothetical protein [Pararhodobacter sp.]|uniref:VHL beta domain-containing protein n=1 Tax=Pararhodobacter sp. TaxID=2127056 RepID=UPI002AFEC180|nr:hypothetical protein [Pararhodobacter sp.]